MLWARIISLSALVRVSTILQTPVPEQTTLSPASTPALMPLGASIPFLVPRLVMATPPAPQIVETTTPFPVSRPVTSTQPAAGTPSLVPVLAMRTQRQLQYVHRG